MKCLICTALETSENTLFTTKYWVVNLAPDQGYLGRAYVMLKEHKASLSDLDPSEWTEFAEVVKKLESACSKAFSAMPFNWASMMNNAYQQSPADPHVHWHFRPRYRSAVTINKQAFTDSLYGYHYDREDRNHVDPETFGIIRDTLRASL